MPNQPAILWQPTEAFANQSNLRAYQAWLKDKYGLDLTDYSALWTWSVENPANFWESMWAYFEIIHHTPYTEVMSADPMPHTKWFSGSTLNYAEHIFRNRTQDQAALIFQNETGRSELNWNELAQKVAAVQSYLRAKGVGKGDRVAAYLPNIPEAIICFLAVNGLGAVWSCCSPDFGVDTVIERFAQIEPKLLIAVDGYQYNGKPHRRMDQVNGIRGNLPSVIETLFIPYLNPGAKLMDKTAHWWDVIGVASTAAEVHFEPVPFDHPIWVLYSSGTTGRPKAITHSHGGVLLEHLKYLTFHNDVHPGENFFWFTTTGWMMWNFLQASMLVGATPVLFDGSPAYPDMNVLWEMTAALPVHHFGTSAPYLTACMKREMQPGQDFDLKALRSIGSTGAPLPPEAFRWVYEGIKSDVWLCSMSGGTDVCTAFVGGNPFAPVYLGHIQCRALGCALYAYDDEGKRVDGALGEMVIEAPMPSMPIYFWNDPEMQRYQSSYFAEYPGKWRHGDWIKIFETNSLIIQGRSDATLNRKGIRIGTAEIYNVLDKIQGLKDGLVLNLEQPNGEDVMPLFVVLDTGQTLTAELSKEIKTNLKLQCSPRHVPDEIHQVPDIPYTLSGKKMEVPVKKVLLGMDISKSLNQDAIRNPDALNWFINYAKR